MFKKNMPLSWILIFVMYFASAAEAKTRTSQIDVNNSRVAWVGYKVSGEHSGTLKISSGSIVVNRNKLKSATIVMDLNSIINLDVASPEWNSKLVNHLKSDDFFDVSNHPLATLEITSASRLPTGSVEGMNTLLSGDLTIKGITQAVQFEADLDINKKSARASGEIMIDRSKFDIRYKSGSFFENLGDKLINDEFSISFDLVVK